MNQFLYLHGQGFKRHTGCQSSTNPCASMKRLLPALNRALVLSLEKDLFGFLSFSRARKEMPTWKASSAMFVGLLVFGELDCDARGSTYSDLSILHTN